MKAKASQFTLPRAAVIAESCAIALFITLIGFVSFAYHTDSTINLTWMIDYICLPLLPIYSMIDSSIDLQPSLSATLCWSSVLLGYVLLSFGLFLILRRFRSGHIE